MMVFPSFAWVWSISMWFLKLHCVLICMSFFCDAVQLKKIRAEVLPMFHFIMAGGGGFGGQKT